MIEAQLQHGAKFLPKSFSGLLNRAYYGDVYYVHATNGSDTANTGTSPSQPFASLEKAINSATANNDDVIILMSGHAENVASATALNFDKAGINIIGVGVGSRRPTITLTTATTATIPVSANNIYVENVVFSANFADIVSTFTLAAAKWFTLYKCDFVATATDMNFLHVIDTNTTDNSYDGLTITECNWFEPDAATLAFMLADASADKVNISDNVINNGNATADTAALVTFAAGKIWTNARIQRNNVSVVGNATSTAGLFMTTNSTTHTGLETDNFLSHIDATTELFQTANMGFGLNNNKATGVKATQGYLLPAADA